jgi:hypothetical protein
LWEPNPKTGSAKNYKRIALEMETGNSDEVENIHNNLCGGLSIIIFVLLNAEEKRIIIKKYRRIIYL